MRWLAAVTIVLLASGCASAGSNKRHDPQQSQRHPSPSAAFSAHGAITVTGEDNVGIISDAVTPGQECFGAGGAADIAPGAQVVVTDASGRTVAVGKMEMGRTTEHKRYKNPRYDEQCVVPFTVSDVPSGEKFYGIKVGQRPATQETEAEMRAAPGLKLSIG